MKLNQMPPLPAYEDFIRMLRIAAEPELYLEQMQALESARDALNKRAGDVKRLSNVDALETAAMADREKARSDRAAAEAQVRQTNEQLEAEARSARLALKDELESGKALVAERDKASKAKAAELKRREEAVERREATASNRDQELAAREKQLAGMLADYEEKVQRLKSAMG